MSLTIELLRTINTAFEPRTLLISQDRLVKLSQLSATNRMLFFYLHSLDAKNLGKLADLYKNELIIYIKTNRAIDRASKILANANIEYAFFKTIRPYTSTTVDLDIIIFGEYDDYIKSVKVMKNAGYKLVTHGPKSTTLLDREANIGIDLYAEIAVSLITYMNKRTLYQYVTTTKLPNGEYVKILEPEADLACIIAHSIIKEQMYTLSEYYTFIYYLKQMNIDNFIHILKQNNITSGARTHASLTAVLHKVAHKTIPQELQKILRALGKEKLETKRLIQKNFETPHKYHPITVAKCLLEIAKSRKTRNSIAMQIYQMLYPNFTKKLLKDVLKHAKRETY